MVGFFSWHFVGSEIGVLDVCGKDRTTETGSSLRHNVTLNPQLQASGFGFYH